jgi:hypothetical protein
LAVPKASGRGQKPEDSEKDDGNATEKRQKSCARRDQDAELEIMVGVSGDKHSPCNEDDSRDPFCFFHVDTGLDFRK